MKSYYLTLIQFSASFILNTPPNHLQLALLNTFMKSHSVCEISDRAYRVWIVCLYKYSLYSMSIQ